MYTRKKYDNPFDGYWHQWNVVVNCRESFKDKLFKYVESFCEKNSYYFMSDPFKGEPYDKQDDRDDIYKVDLENLKSVPRNRMQKLSVSQQFSLLTVWRVQDFILNFSAFEEDHGEYNIFSDYEKSLVKMSILFHSLFQHYNAVKDDLEKDLSALFESLFNETLPLIKYEINPYWLDNTGYFKYFDNKRRDTIYKQLVSNPGSAVVDLQVFLDSELSDKDKSIILRLLQAEISETWNEQQKSQFHQCITACARAGVGGAACFMLENNPEGSFKLSPDYSLQEKIAFIKGLLADVKNNNQKMIRPAFDLIAELITSNIINIDKVVVEDLMGLLRAKARLLCRNDDKARVVIRLHDMIQVIEAERKERKDLARLIYPLKLLVATIFNSLLHNQCDAEILMKYLEKQGLKIPEDAYGYLKLREDYLETMKFTRLLGEVYRMKGLFKTTLSVVAEGSPDEDEMAAMLELAQKHFYKPV